MIKLNKKGFTLIELLVVIAIIGILSTLAVVSLGDSRTKARNAKRYADAKVLQTAVEIYMTENSMAPVVPAAAAGAWASVGSTLSTYLKTGMPEDPSSPANTWCYCRDTDQTKYLIAVALEGTASSTDLDGAASTYAVGECICNNDSQPSAVINCNDDTGGNLNGANKNVYCIGSL